MSRYKEDAEFRRKHNLYVKRNNERRTARLIEEIPENDDEESLGADFIRQMFKEHMVENGKEPKTNKKK